MSTSTVIPEPVPARPRFFGELSTQGRMLLSQMPLATSTLVVFAACIYLRPGATLDSVPFLLGVAGIAVLTIMSGTIPWGRLPTGAYWIIPLLDFVAIAPIWDYARFMLDGMVFLTAFPVVWLTWSGLYPALAISLGVLGTAGVTWWPYLIRLSELSPDEILRPALVPLFMLALAVATSVLTNSMDRQHKEMEETLALARQQNRMLETVLETSQVGIVVTDRDGNDLIMNAAQRRSHLIGLPPGVDDAPEHELIVYEADGTTPIAPEDRPVRRAVLGENFEGRLITLGNPPGQQTMSVAAQAIVDDDGEFDGTVVIFQNVTELLNAFQARERFIADVSHEFRTPLTSIIGYLELAEDEDVDPVLASYLATIHRNAERLLRLVTSLLDAAADFTNLAVRPQNLTKLLHHSAESAVVRARAGGLELVTDIPDELIVVGDAMRLSQIVDNLLSNAIKYTDVGGTVTLWAHGDDDAVEFSVSDTGVGMTPDELEKVFSSFYRTEQVRKAAIPGTGLGLSIVERLVQAHDGTITAHSRPGVGTTFTVRLPVAGPGA